MLLNEYDLFDMYATLVAIRFKPDAPCHAQVIRCIENILSAPQTTNYVESNRIREALRHIDGLDAELFSWVYVDNVYTYMHRLEKNIFYYTFLSRAFEKLHQYAERKNSERLKDLADALHNIPILIADGCKDFKRSATIQLAGYKKKYGEDLWKEFSKE